MLTKEQNERITRVGPNTPLGKLMRRYWHPVGVSDRIKKGGPPVPVKVMGEELTLFRNSEGIPALMSRRCAHRLTSLAYGRVEDGGIRCPFHGWLYDITGRCIQTPAEPDESRLKNSIRLTAYPCRELGGLIFTYMGPPDKMPDLPRYESLAREDGTRTFDVYSAGGNYLQHVEGAIDTSHLSYLHATNWSQTKHKLFAMPKPLLEHRETDYGLWQKSWIPNVTIHPDFGNVADGIMQTLYTYFILPAGFLRVQEHMPNSGLVQKIQSWYVPIDDENTTRYQVGFSPPWPDGRPYEWPTARTEDPTASNDYFRDYENTDTISGIPVTAHRTPIQANISYIPQDTMANEEQGAICDRTQEHLSPNDAIIARMRRIYFTNIDKVETGEDPTHLLREQGEAIHYIRGLEDGELV
jgi:phthalate 4,5-dioxygenase oxygenase subunit